QSGLGNVAVVAAETAPELSFAGFASGKGEGAARAGGGVFFECLSGLGHCGGDFCGAVLVIMLGVCGVAGLVGGIAGAAEAPDADSVAGNIARLADVVEARQIQQHLRRSIEDAASAAGTVVVRVPEAVARAALAAGDYRPLALHGADSVLETTLTRVGTEGSGIDDPVGVYMQVRVRVVDTVSNETRHVAEYAYQGRRLALGGWAANAGKPLQEELERGYRRLGTHIRDQVFDFYPLPDRDWHSAGGALSVSFGLAPLEPPTRGTLTGDDSFIGRVFEWYAADGSQPRLRWQAFPRPGDIAAAADEMARVSNVRYDLLIAREANMAPAEIVYRREGLTQPEHTVAGGLQPGERYFWTVRARFELDGRQRLTEWGSTHFAAREKLTAPSSFSYRFRIPD
ncbi:MAG TPA: hypothetical protein VFY24_15440, partial [Azospira sp.]|nr:hypothetical protein [Azospira sp.]